MKNKKTLLGLAGALLALMTPVLLPGTVWLGKTANCTLGVLIAFLLLLITEALPIIITSLMMCAIMPLLSVTDNLKTAFEGFTEPVIFFVVASFGIATALTVIPISQRILKKLLSIFGKNIESVLLALMIACAVFSSIVSNIPTCAIFMAISINFLDVYSDIEERKRTGKTLMIAIPVASMIGGMMTPAGSSINILAMSQLERYTGISITFVQWMMFGIPVAIVMIPLAWIVFVKVYHPAKVSESEIQNFTEELKIPKEMDRKEYKVLIIVGGMLALWILSSWVKEINIIIVAIIGCSLLFFPGIDVLDAQTFIHENNWDAFFLVGALSSICNMILKNGISTAVAEALPRFTTSVICVTGICAVLTFGLLLIIPVATALIPVLTPVFIFLAQQIGISPIIVVITAALCACNCYLLPLDTVPLLTYSKGYYSMTEMAKSTWLLQIAMVLLCMIWLPFAASF